MSRKGGGSASSLPKDVPGRASNIKPIPKIHHSPLLRIAPNPTSNYALSVMKHPNPVGSGLAMEAIVESTGPDCIVPGQVAPVKLLGLKVWPLKLTSNFWNQLGDSSSRLERWLVHGFRVVKEDRVIAVSKSLVRKNDLL